MTLGSKGRLILDTNLLVLLVVGMTDRRLIARHKRLQAFDEIDFDLIREAVQRHNGLILIPHVVSETSNLARHMGGIHNIAVTRTLASVVHQHPEEVISSRDAVKRAEYERLGATDAALLVLHESGGILLTDDVGLYLAASNAGHNAINYNHIREVRPDFR